MKADKETTTTEQNELHLMTTGTDGIGNVVDIVANARREAQQRKEEEEQMWDRDNPDMVCPPQAATVVYTNNYGQAVICQQAAWNDNEDTYIIISKHYLQDVIDRLQMILAEQG